MPNSRHSFSLVPLLFPYSSLLFSTLSLFPCPYICTDLRFIIINIIFYHSVPLTKLQQWSPSTNVTADGPLSFQSQKNLLFGMAGATSASVVSLTGVSKLTACWAAADIQPGAWSPNCYIPWVPPFSCVYSVNSGQAVPKIKTKHRT